MLVIFEFYKLGIAKSGKYVFFNESKSQKARWRSHRTRQKSRNCPPIKAASAIQVWQRSAPVGLPSIDALRPF